MKVKILHSSKIKDASYEDKNRPKNLLRSRDVYCLNPSAEIDLNTTRQRKKDAVRLKKEQCNSWPREVLFFFWNNCFWWISVKSDLCCSFLLLLLLLLFFFGYCSETKDSPVNLGTSWARKLINIRVKKKRNTGQWENWRTNAHIRSKFNIRREKKVFLRYEGPQK